MAPQLGSELSSKFQSDLSHLKASDADLSTTKSAENRQQGTEKHQNAFVLGTRNDFHGLLLCLYVQGIQNQTRIMSAISSSATPYTASPFMIPCT